MESSRIMESSQFPSVAKATHVPEHHIHTGWELHHWSLFQCLITPSMKELSLMSNLNLC